MIFRATPMTQPPNRLKSLFRPGFLAARLGPFTVAAQRLLRTSPSERSGAENHPTERGRRVGDELKKMLAKIERFDDDSIIIEIMIDDDKMIING